MFSYPRLGRETRPSMDSSVTLPTNPAPSYDSGVGYTNSTLQHELRNAGYQDCLVVFKIELTDYKGITSQRRNHITKEGCLIGFSVVNLIEIC